MALNPAIILARLLMAALCCGLIGFERETARKPAGLRTHTLIGLGAAVFSIASIGAFDGPDESRIAAQIVTGVGFLGAGAIFRDRGAVSGLTTAAGIWVAAAVGMASGAGAYWLAIIGTTMTLAALYALRAVDHAVARRTDTVRKQISIDVDNVAKLDSLLRFIERVDDEAVQEDFLRLADGTGVMTISCEPDKAAMIADLVSSHKIVTGVELVKAIHTPPSGETRPRT